MKVTTFRHKNVSKNGKVKGGGAVHTTGAIIMSQDKGGCGIDTCHCSDGHWITIVEPRTKNGIVKGLTAQFENKVEMELFLTMKELPSKKLQHRCEKEISEINLALSRYHQLNNIKPS